MKAQSILKLMLPFVPSGYRTAGGAVLIALGTILGILADPSLVALFPDSWMDLAPKIVGWGAAVMVLGFRFKGQS